MKLKDLAKLKDFNFIKSYTRYIIKIWKSIINFFFNLFYRRENHAKNTIGILIRLLMNIEDQVWYEINENKFIIATTLLQLAVHIKTGSFIS